MWASNRTADEWVNIGLFVWRPPHHHHLHHLITSSIRAARHICVCLLVITTNNTSHLQLYERRAAAEMSGEKNTHHFKLTLGASAVCWPPVQVLHLIIYSLLHVQISILVVSGMLTWRLVQDYRIKRHWMIVEMVIMMCFKRSAELLTGQWRSISNLLLNNKFPFLFFSFSLCRSGCP